VTARIDLNSLPRHRVPRLVLSPRRILADLLSKGWVESTVPFLAFIATVIGIVLATDGYFTAANLRNLALYAGDGGLVILAMLIVVAAGGLDLSVGSSFAMSAFVALYAFHILGLPVPAVLLLSLTSGLAVGMVNGTLAGLIVGLAGFLFAARQNSIAADTGIGMAFFVLTALVVGLGGFVPGRGRWFRCC